MSLLGSTTTAEAILNIALHLTGVLVLGWLFMRLVRRKPAPLRSGVCFAAMLIILLVPFLSLGLVDWGLPRYVASVPVLPDSSTADAVAQDAGLESVPTGALAVTNLEPKSRTNRPLSDLIGGNSDFVFLINLVGLIWGIGSFFLLLRLGYGAHSLKKFTKDKRPVSGDHIRSVLDEAVSRFGRTIRTRIYESPRVTGPVVVGLFRPKILLPQGLLKRLRPGELRGILLHELSHIRHRDHVSAVIQRLSTALTWWNPLSHALSRAFSRAREEVSDNHVLLDNNSHEYAECLINLAERTSRLRRLPVGFAMASPHIPLADRIKNILSKERTMETQLKKGSLLLIVLLAVLLVGGLTGYRLTFAESAVEDSLSTRTESDPIQTTDAAQDRKRGVKHPKLIKKVDPVYPKEASELDIEGTVAVEAKIETDGTVVDAKVIHSAHDLLDKASLNAVRRWAYEPMEIDGKPVAAMMTVIFRFRMEDNRPEVAILTDETGTADKKPPLRARGDIKPPKLIKRVQPNYPEEAKEDGIEGVVILEATTDIYGRVTDTRILRSIPALDQAAEDAVKQWVYEPMIAGGKPHGITFTVTLRFRLDKDTGGVTGGVVGGVTGGVKSDVKGKVIGGVEGGVKGGIVGGAKAVVDKGVDVDAGVDIKPPKLIKMVKPVYPKEAKEAGIEGVVILELKTDIYGRVKDVKILRSIPELDQAAIDAVKQWVYEPMIVDGKPREHVMTVTVRFEKDEETDVIK